jgi:hypothetical protein
MNEWSTLKYHCDVLVVWVRAAYSDGNGIDSQFAWDFSWFYSLYIQVFLNRPHQSHVTERHSPIRRCVTNASVRRESCRTISLMQSTCFARFCERLQRRTQILKPQHQSRVKTNVTVVEAGWMTSSADWVTCSWIQPHSYIETASRAHSHLLRIEHCRHSQLSKWDVILVSYYISKGDLFLEILALGFYGVDYKLFWTFISLLEPEQSQ